MFLSQPQRAQLIRIGRRVAEAARRPAAASADRFGADGEIASLANSIRSLVIESAAATRAGSVDRHERLVAAHELLIGSDGDDGQGLDPDQLSEIDKTVPLSALELERGVVALTASENLRAQELALGAIVRTRFTELSICWLGPRPAATTFDDSMFESPEEAFRYFDAFAPRVLDGTADRNERMSVAEAALRIRAGLVMDEITRTLASPRTAYDRCLGGVAALVHGGDPMRLASYSSYELLWPAIDTATDPKTQFALFSYGYDVGPTVRGSIETFSRFYEVPDRNINLGGAKLDPRGPESGSLE